jgi:hypothetical protein
MINNTAAMRSQPNLLEIGRITAFGAASGTCSLNFTQAASGSTAQDFYFRSRSTQTAQIPSGFQDLQQANGSTQYPLPDLFLLADILLTDRRSSYSGIKKIAVKQEYQ